MALQVILSQLPKVSDVQSNICLKLYPKPKLGMFCALSWSYQHFKRYNMIILKLTAWDTQKLHQNFSRRSQARSQGGGGGAGGATHPPKSTKRSTFSHKVDQKWGFCRRVKGGEVQKVHFLGLKGPLFWVPHPPKSILATGLGAAFLELLIKTWNTLFLFLFLFLFCFFSSSSSSFFFFFLKKCWSPGLIHFR